MRLAVVFLALCTLSCAEPPEVDAPLLVATSIPPHAWLVEKIGGDAVEAVPILGPGDNPATFQPSDAGVSRVMSARVVFTTGVPFEAGTWLAALADHLEIVDLGDGVNDRFMADHRHGNEPLPVDHEHAAVDPHAWLCPDRLATQAHRVAEALSRLDPDRAPTYADNLTSLTTELEELDGELRTVLGPHRDRAFVVFHPSWGYFADAYSLEQIAIEIEGKEPSDAEITALQLRARELGISAVFVQPQIAARSARAVADALGVEIATLDPLAADIPANLRRTAAVLAGGFDG